VSREIKKEGKEKEINIQEPGKLFKNKEKSPIDKKGEGGGEGRKLPFCRRKRVGRPFPEIKSEKGDSGKSQAL